MSFFNFTYRSNAKLKHASLWSCKIKLSRKILISLVYHTQCLLISTLFTESSHAYSATSFIEAGNTAVINVGGSIVQPNKCKASHTEPINSHNCTQSHSEASPHTTIRPLENIADNSQITKSISTNAQGADTKTYRIKPASASSKAYDHSQVNELNRNTMKWESELKSIELLKPSPYNSVSNSKLR